MTIKERADPDEYTPKHDSVPAAEEYEPEASADDPTREANPADVAERLAAFLRTTRIRRTLKPRVGPTDAGSGTVGEGTTKRVATG